MAATLGVVGSIVGCGGDLGGGGKGGSGGEGGTGPAGTGTGGVADNGGHAGAVGAGGAAGMSGAGGAGDPMGVGGAGGICAELPDSMTTCADCTNANCSIGFSGTDGCCGLTDPADQTLCKALYACIAANTASCTSSGDPTQCFCGTTNDPCFTTDGAANGPCAAQFIAAAKTTDAAQIHDRFVSPKFPIGRAVNLTACRGAFCQAECGIK
jgi:hypothetical protein